MRAQVLEFSDTASIARNLARLSLAGLIVFLPIRKRFILLENPHPPIYKDYTDVLLFVGDIFLIATLLFWLISLLLQPRKIKFGPAFLNIPLAGLTGTALLSGVFSIELSITANHAARLLLLAGLYLYIVNEFVNLEEMILPLSIQVLIQSFIGIGQAMRQHSLGLQLFGELDLDPAWSGVSIVWSEGIRSLRAYGLSDHPNILGGSLAFALVFIAAWFAAARIRARTAVVAVYVLGGLCLFYTFSRSAWLAFVASTALLAFAYLKTRQKQLASNWFYLNLAGLIVLLPFVLQNLNYLGVRLNYGGSFTTVPQENQSIGERALLNRAANMIFADHALTGVGLGTLPLAMLARYPDFPVNYQPAHFVLLDAAAETGIFGALFFLILTISPWIALFLNRRRLVFSPALIGVTALLLSLTIVGFLDYYTWLLPAGRLWQWITWGLWAVVYQASFREVIHA